MVRRIVPLLGGMLMIGQAWAAGPGAMTVLSEIARNGTYGCRRSFGHGLYDAEADRTVVCWNGPGMSIFVRAFDHAAGTWTESVQAWELDFTGTWDYHNYPVMVQAPDGHHLVFHFVHSSEAYLLRSPAPHRIDGPWTYRKISADHCAYPMPVVVGEAVYLFYSSTVAHWHRPYMMIKSTDNGATWSEPVRLIDSGHREPEKYDEVYLHGFCIDPARKGRAARILLGWEMASGPGGHNIGGHGNFFAAYDCDTGRMQNAAGKTLGETVDLREMYDDCIVNDAKDPGSRLFGYTTLPVVLPGGEAGVAYSLRGRKYIARWTADGWRTVEIENVSGGIAGYRQSGSGTYLLLTLAGGTRTMVWESSDGLTGWKKRSETALPSVNGSDSAVVGFIDNFRSEVQWMAVTFDGEVRQNDYSGKWPVYVFGTAASHAE